MPGTQEEDGKNAAANQIDDQFNQALIEILAEELHYRFKCLIDEWNRNHWLSRFRKNPHEEKLNGFNLYYSNPVCSDAVSVLQVQASAIVKAAKKLNDPPAHNHFSQSVEAVFKRQQILSTSSEKNIDEKITDPVVLECVAGLYKAQKLQPDNQKKEAEAAVAIEAAEKTIGFDKIPDYESLKTKNRWEKLYLKAKYPHLLQTDALSLDLPVSSEQKSPVKEAKEDLSKDLKDIIKQKISSLYPNGSAQQDLTTEGILKNISSTWYGFFGGADEKKTVKLILEAVDNYPSIQIDMVAVERRLQRLEGQIAQGNSKSQSGRQVVPATDHGDTFKKIRAAFGEIRFAAKIDRVVTHNKKLHEDKQAELDGRISQLQQYNEAINSKERLNESIDSTKLPTAKEDLDALVYFIFQHNIKQKAPAGVIPFFPISWTEEAGLTIGPDAGKYADLLTIFNQDLLDNTNPEFYFAALMTAMAQFLEPKDSDESYQLKLLLKAIFQGGNYYENHLKTSSAISSRKNLSWLMDYLPTQITVHEDEENAKVVGEKEKLSAKGMIPNDEIPVIKNLSLQEIKARFSSITQYINADLSIKENNMANAYERADQTFNDNFIKGVSADVMLLHALIVWFFICLDDDTKSEFRSELIEWEDKLKQIIELGSSQKYADQAPIELDLTSLDGKVNAKHDVSVVGVTISAYQLTPEKRSQASKFIEHIRSIFPRGIKIFPGGKISEQVENISSTDSSANRCAQVAYDLCLKFQEKYPKENYAESKSLKLLNQHDQMLRALSFAVTSEQAEFPDLADVMPKLSPKATGVFKDHLDEIKRIAASARDFYQSTVAKTDSSRDKIVSQDGGRKLSAKNSPDNSLPPGDHQLTDSGVGLFSASHSWGITQIRDVAMPMIQEVIRLNAASQELSTQDAFSEDDEKICKKIEKEISNNFGHINLPNKTQQCALVTYYLLNWYRASTQPWSALILDIIDEANVTIGRFLKDKRIEESTAFKLVLHDSGASTRDTTILSNINKAMKNSVPEACHTPGVSAKV